MCKQCSGSREKKAKTNTSFGVQRPTLELPSSFVHNPSLTECNDIFQQLGHHNSSHRHEPYKKLERH